MKKIIVCMICICIALAGCGKEKSVVKEKKQKEVLRLTTKGKELVLKNLMNYKVVNKYKLGKKQCTGSIIELDQGYFDLKNKKIHTFIEKKYEAFSLNVDKRYIWINDGENPNTKTASGKVPVIDTKTGKNHLVHLDGIESAKARITEDGKYMIAASQTDEKSFRVRQYDIKNEKVLKEKKYDFHKSVHVNDIISINNGKSYGIIYSTDQGDKLEEFELR